MSEFLKFAYELLSQVVYNLVQWGVAFVKLFVTGWAEYFLIFKTYFADLSIAGKILSVLLMIILIAIPVTIIILIVKRAVWVGKRESSGGRKRIYGSYSSSFSGRQAYFA